MLLTNYLTKPHIIHQESINKKKYNYYELLLTTQIHLRARLTVNLYQCVCVTVSVCVPLLALLCRCNKLLVCFSAPTVGCTRLLCCCRYAFTHREKMLKTLPSASRHATFHCTPAIQCQKGLGVEQRDTPPAKTMCPQLVQQSLHSYE